MDRILKDYAYRKTHNQMVFKKRSKEKHTAMNIEGKSILKKLINSNYKKKNVSQHMKV